MIDCHAHLALEDFDADREAVLQRAAAAGVELVLAVAEDSADARRTLEIAQRHPRVRPCIGLHPDRYADDRSDPADELEAVCELVREHAGRLAAIGEVGLDHWYVRSPERRRAQAQALERFVELSRETNLALNVHSRSAGRATLELLVAAGADRVLMHAFDAKAGRARAGIDAGYVFSIPPSAVRSDQKKRLIRFLPLEAMALESDSPVLGPERGTRNEPANLEHTVELIAEIHRVSHERVIELTSTNARRLFALDAEAH